MQVETETGTSTKASVAPHKSKPEVELKPGQMYVKKRDNTTVVPLDKYKIIVAITSAFRDVEGSNVAASPRVRDLVNSITEGVIGYFEKKLQETNIAHVEDIQDRVELELMRRELHHVARKYVIYREERRREREAKVHTADPHPELTITRKDGQRVPLDQAWLTAVATEACRDLAEVDPAKIVKDTLRNLFDGVQEADVRKALIMSARTMVETEPNYSYVTARLLLDDLRGEAFGFLGLKAPETIAELPKHYGFAFATFIHRGIELEHLSPRLAEFDLDRLSQAIKAERDYQFSYLGLQTLYDRYFIHHDNVRFELPQAFFMRVAMGLAIEEDDKNARAIEFYNQLSSFDYMSSTPTLFNSGTLRPQLSSCYLTTVPDDLSAIYNAMRDNALLSKFAGGLGNDWTPVRAMGAYIKGTNGKSQGVVPFLKVANDTAVAVNQGGKRKGAVCAYLETWHLDVEEFLDLRKNTGDERRRTHDMNTANWIPDLFMERVMLDANWTLFSPEEAPDLHDTYGNTFRERYETYERAAAAGKIRNYKTVSAKALWRKMLQMLFETGHPWVTFKDACNLRSPQQHTGVIHSSNLCTEITLNTSEEEIAVCNLGSINLVQHIKDGALDKEKLRKTVRTAIRMLDNVIDINYYSVPQARNSNLKHRPIGMGLMGFQDTLYELDIAYASDEAVRFADESMELISYYAIEASSDLAKERGSYSTFEGSLWSQGILPIDSLKILANHRGKEYLEVDTTTRLDWTTLRSKVKTQGMRNSNVMAIAPTATIANITGVSASIEPTYQNLFVKSNLSGEFTLVNPYLIKDLKDRKLWDEVMVNDLKYFNGSIQTIDRIPDDIKAKYRTAFEVEPEWLIQAGARRQKWIDQAQSLNLYIAKPSGSLINRVYTSAWMSGLKTTYYLRTLGATDAEKSTVDNRALNAVAVDAPKACSIDNPDCEACQ